MEKTKTWSKTEKHQPTVKMAALTFTLLAVLCLVNSVCYASKNPNKQALPEDSSLNSPFAMDPRASIEEADDNNSLVEKRTEILNDFDNKIPKDFKISKGLKNRVSFWFDVYSQYDSNHRIIHHATYPWIIYKIVDVSPIINAKVPSRRWMRNEKADKFVKNESTNIKLALLTLSRKGLGGSFSKLNEYEKIVMEALEGLPGSKKEKIKFASNNVRVQTGQKNFFKDGLEVSPKYLPAMEEIFKRNKVPVELTRIPFVESSFNKNAVSKVGASGMWQFMDYTGRKFMIVNNHIDERHSPFKAAEAAAKLFKENHMILHKSWPLAITAWNHGPTGIRKAMKEAHTRDLSEIIQNYRSKQFDFASSNFYSEFLAALYTERYKEHIFKDLNPEKQIQIHVVKLSRGISAKELLRVSGLSKDQFIMFNPDLKKAVDGNAPIPPGFRLMLNDSARIVLKSLLTQEGRVTKSKMGRINVSDNISTQ
jgi:membrane-bound lytic murein transglycosylase D